MEKVSTNIEKNIPSKRPDLWKAVIILFFLIALAIAGWYIYPKAHKTTSNTPIVSWAEYKATKYGFKFDYLKAWGTPSLHVESQQPLPGASSLTSIYAIAFPDSAAGQRQSALSITFSPDTSASNSCAPSDSNCPGTTFLSASLIKNILAHNKKSFVKYTDTSFATLASSSNHSLALNIAQIVNMPKLNVSAASLNYTLSQAAQSCPKSQLAQNTQTQCITQTDYSDFSQALGSLSSL